MANASVEVESQKKVKEVVKDFLLKGDESLALNLQDKEFDEKYEWNRFQGKLARTDVPLAKKTYTEEELRLQNERMKQLKEINAVTERDEQIIKEFMEKEEREKEKIRRQQQEASEKLAFDIHNQEFAREKEQLFKDLELAKIYENGQVNGPMMQNFQSLCFEDEDYNDVKEQKTLQTLQDEELARALQEHENKKAISRKKSQIEYDAELVKQLQQKEYDKLKQSRSCTSEHNVIPVSNFSEAIGPYPPEYSQVIKKNRSSHGEAYAGHDGDKNLNDLNKNSNYSYVEKTVITTTKSLKNGKGEQVKTTSVQKFKNMP